MNFDNLYSAIIYLVCCYFLFWLGKLVYDLIHKDINVKDELVQKDNAGAIVGVANIVRHAIGEDFTSWGDSLLTIGCFFAFGIFLLPLIRLFTDKVLLPGAKLTDEIVNQEKPNLGAAFIAAFSYIGSSFLITWCL